MLPFRVILGAMVVLAASLLTERELLDRLVERDWNVVAYMAVAVVVGYGPSLLWLWFVSRRWGPAACAPTSASALGRRTSAGGR